MGGAAIGWLTLWYVINEDGDALKRKGRLQAIALCGSRRGLLANMQRPLPCYVHPQPLLHVMVTLQWTGDLGLTLPLSETLWAALRMTD